MNRKMLSLILLGGALGLSACGQAPLSQNTPTSALTTLTVRAPLSKSNKGLTTQGVPSTFWGSTVVDALKLKVYKQQDDGSLVRAHFNDRNMFDVNGSRDYLVLTPEANTLTLKLPPSTYTFESVGIYGEVDGNTVYGDFVAYGKQEDLDLSEPTASVELEVHTLADPRDAQSNGDEEGSALIMPTWFFGPDGQPAVLNHEYEAFLFLSVANHGGAVVPQSDYSVTYTVDKGSVVGQPNKVGVRFKADGAVTPDDLLNVTAKVKAWVPSEEEEAASEQEFELKLGMDYFKQNASLDLIPPSLTLNEPGLGEEGWTISGDASDNMPWTYVALYDGTEQIGWYYPEEDCDQEGNCIISNSLSFNRWLAPGKHHLWALARDAAGNETRTPVMNVDLPEPNQGN